FVVGRAVPPHVAAVIAPLLMRELARARRVGENVADDVVDCIEGLELDADRWLNRQRQRSSETSETRGVDTRRFGDVEMVDVKRAVEISGVSEQAVRGLCRRRALHAVRAGRSWRICLEDLEARKEGAKCP